MRVEGRNGQRGDRESEEDGKIRTEQGKNRMRVKGKQNKGYESGEE